MQAPDSQSTARLPPGGTLVDGTQVVGLEDLSGALLSHSELFVTNVTEKLMTYAVGRALDHRDMPAVRAVVRQARKGNLQFSALIQGIVHSETFRERVKSTPGAGLSAGK